MTGRNPWIKRVRPPSLSLAEERFLDHLHGFNVDEGETDAYTLVTRLKAEVGLDSATLVALCNHVESTMLAFIEGDLEATSRLINAARRSKADDWASYLLLKADGTMQSSVASGAKKHQVPSVQPALGAICPSCRTGKRSRRARSQPSRGKQIFPSEEAALSFTREFVEGVDAFPQRPYPCPLGFGWHLSTDYELYDNPENLKKVLVSFTDQTGTETSVAISVTTKSREAVLSSLQRRFPRRAGIVIRSLRWFEETLI